MEEKADLFREKLHVFSVAEQDVGKRIDKFLSEKLQDLSRSRIKGLIQEGRVRIDGQKIFLAKKKVKYSQKIDISIPPPRPLEIVPRPMSINVLFQDEYILVIDKPAGITVHPGAGNLDNTLVHGLLSICSDLSGIGGVLRPGIVHRLDKDTSGIMLVAKNDLSHRALVDMFKSRGIKKVYRALIKGCMDDLRGKIDLPIGRDPHRRVRMAVNFQNGKAALTTYEVIESYDGFQYLGLRLHTGRTHQIRVHLAHIGRPILGDTLYGGPCIITTPNGQMKIERQMLHAYSLEFIHPITKEKILVTSRLPDDFRQLLQVFEGSGSELTDG